MAWTDRTIQTNVRISIERDQIRIELTLDNQSGNDVFIPDVSFVSTKEGIKVNQALLPIVVNSNNMLEANLLVQPLDPKIQWASPPTFFTHVVHPRSRYQREWLLPYPVRIPAKDNHGMGRLVQVSTDFIVNIGVIQPPVSYKTKVVEIDGQALYEFGQDALRFQAKQQVVRQNQAINMRVED